MTTHDYGDDDFYAEHDPAPAAVALAPAPTAPLPDVQIRTTARHIAPAAYLMKTDAQWTPADLRDYVVSEITGRFGDIPDRNPAAETAMFKGFSARWGSDAPRIARHAFTICDGWWRNSPVRLGRFAVKSDPYFAAEIVKLLPQAQR